MFFIELTTVFSKEIQEKPDPSYNTCAFVKLYPDTLLFIKSERI